MSANKILFERGTRMASDSEHEVLTNVHSYEGVDEDVWDDRKLNDAYDKALKIANAEVAKRVAMSTNTHHERAEEPRQKKKNTKGKQSGSSSSKVKTEWKSGMSCRAVYEDDGLEYEAFVLRIISDKECIVRFLGYENCEIVPLDSLLPSLGKNEREKQIEQATLEKNEDQPNLEWRECESDRVPSPGSTEFSFGRRQKSPKKKNQKQANFCGMPEMPFPLPNISMMPNLGSLDLPMPPPPPMAIPHERIDSEDHAVSSMLLSWYMSGYYTGLYQGMKRAKQARRRV